MCTLPFTPLLLLGGATAKLCVDIAGQVHKNGKEPPIVEVLHNLFIDVQVNQHPSPVAAVAAPGHAPHHSVEDDEAFARALQVRPQAFSSAPVTFALQGSFLRASGCGCNVTASVNDICRSSSIAKTQWPRDVQEGKR